MKKGIRVLCILIFSCLILTFVYLAFAFLGNPVSYLLSKHAANQYMDEHFENTDFQIEKVAYNLKTGGYFARVESPSSRDSHFTVYFDGLGRYQYDSYDAVTSKENTFARLNDNYRELTKSALDAGNMPYDISIGFGELRMKGMYEIFHYLDESGNRREYTLNQDYGLDREMLELDQEYDIRALGREHGHLCVYIHDDVLTVERTARILLELKDHLDQENVPFYAIDFHLCEPRNEQGQLVGDQITLFEFLYSDIYEDGLVGRVQTYWDIAQEHYALQDGYKNTAESIHSAASIQEVLP